MFELWQCLSRRRRTQILLLLLLMLGSGLAEAFTLAAVLPLISVMLDPLRLWQVPFVQQLAKWVGLNQANDLIVPTVLMFCVVTLAAGTVRLLALWASGRLAAAIGSDLSAEAYRRTLYQPYLTHVARNSSEIISTLTAQVSQVVNGAISPALQVVANGLILFALVITLTIVDWRLTASLGGVVVLAYLAIVFGSRPRLSRNSQLHMHMHAYQVKAVQEGLGAIREIILSGHQGFYAALYRRADISIRRAIASTGFIAGFPRYALETVAMLVVAGVAFVLSTQSGGLVAALPILAAFVLGAQRLFPAFQHLYSGWASMRGNRFALRNVLDLVQQPLSREASESSISPLHLNRAVELKGIRFCYGQNEPWVLDGISLTLHKGERLGIMGPSGGGKSTLMDVLLGLIEPQEGEVDIDGNLLYRTNSSHRLQAWRRSVAHVPQNIFLLDGTIAENIALGEPKEQIDMLRVRQATKLAQLETFIESCAAGFDTFVGERGVRLSGGQRQRLGIARALYQNVDLLVLDEASSALDYHTEQALMDTIYALNRDLTLVIVAHRLSTLATCNRVLEIAAGRIICEYIGPQISALIDANKVFTTPRT